MLEVRQAVKLAGTRQQALRGASLDLQFSAFSAFSALPAITAFPAP